MSDEVDDLKKQWNVAKKAIASGNVSAAQLAELGRKRKKDIIWFQYGNAIILSVLVVVLVVSFRFFFPYRETLSRIGINLMIWGIVVRIVVEIFSVIRSKQIRLLDDSVSTLGNTIAYYRFRKTVHGPVTYSIVALYTIGYYMLTPESLKYISATLMWFYNILYVVGGIILVWQIRKGIRKEMDTLKEVVKMREEFTSVP